MNGEGQPNPEGEAPFDLPSPRPDEIVETPSSKSEGLAFRLGLDLKAKQTSREIQRITRDESAQGHIHNMIVIAIYAVGISALAMFLVLIWHYITPCEFLTAEKLNNIKQILFSGTLGAALSGVTKKYLGFDAKRDAD